MPKVVCPTCGVQRWVRRMTIEAALERTGDMPLCTNCTTTAKGRRKSTGMGAKFLPCRSCGRPRWVPTAKADRPCQKCKREERLRVLALRPKRPRGRPRTKLRTPTRAPNRVYKFTVTQNYTNLGSAKVHVSSYPVWGINFECPSCGVGLGTREFVNRPPSPKDLEMGTCPACRKSVPAATFPEGAR